MVLKMKEITKYSFNKEVSPFGGDLEGVRS